MITWMGGQAKFRLTPVIIKSVSWSEVMVSDKFRRQLHKEAQQWLAESLIDAEQYQQLSARYQFTTLEIAARNRFVMILLSLGSILLSLAVITFVAANWQSWSRDLKVTLLLSLFFGVNATGFYLWRRPSEEWQHQLGQVLLLLGALILGANMVLMAQIFHVSGLSYGVYLLWAVGVLAMAYSLRLTVLGMLAVLLMGLGYWQGVWLLFSLGEFSWLRLMVQHMPLFAGLMFVPLAYWCRSRWLFGCAAIAVVTSLEMNLTTVTNILSPTGWMGAIAFALPPALLWAHDDKLWVGRPNPELTFRPITRSVALVFLAILFYLFSFQWLWPTTLAENTTLRNWYSLLDVAVLTCWTIFQWLRLSRRLDLTSCILLIVIVVAAFVPAWAFGVKPIPAIATFIFNLLLFLLAAGFIRQGLAQGSRRTFWSGMVLLTLQITSRMLEYQIDLLFKSFVLLMCGIAVIAAGLWFEGRIRTLHLK